MTLWKSRNRKLFDKWLETADNYLILAQRAQRDVLIPQAAMYDALAQAYAICALELSKGKLR